MNILFKADYERFTPHPYKKFASFIRRIRNHELRFLYFGRKYQTTQNRLKKKYYSIKLRKYRKNTSWKLHLQTM